MEPDLDIRVLGSIELARNGAPVPVGGSKPRLALAILAAHRGSVVSTDRMCDELWGDHQPADPAAVLQSHLSRLRRLLRPEAGIVARPPGYLLEVPGETVDAGRFEWLCERAHRASDPRTAVELLEAALDRMPDELRQARWLLKEREEFLADKEREAEGLLEEVRVQAERMVQRTEIVRQANHVAQRILDDANEEARRLRHEAEDYADQKLASFEIVLDRTMKTVQAGREKLQVAPIPNVEIGDGGDTSLGATVLGAGGQHLDEPEGFFDQDLD